MAETDLLFSIKAALKPETLHQCFSISLSTVIAQKGTSPQNDTLNYWGSHSSGIPKLSFRTKVHSSPVHATQQHTVHLLIVNIKYWCGISITGDAKKSALSIIIRVFFFLLVTKKQFWFVGRTPSICYIWGARWAHVKPAIRGWGKMKWNDAWPNEDPHQQP